MRNTLLIILSLIPWLGLTQTGGFSIQRSAVFKDEYKNSDIVLAQDNGNGGVIIVRSYAKGLLSPGGGFYFEQYDQAMNVFNDFEYSVPHANSQKNPVVLGLARINNDVSIVEIFYDLNDKAFICKAHTVNFQSKASKEKELFRISREELKPFGTFGLQQLFFNEGFKADPTAFYGQFTSADNPNEHLRNPGNSDNRGLGNNSGIAFSISPGNTGIAIALKVSNKEAGIVKLFSFDEDFNPIIKYDIKSHSSGDEFQTLTVADHGKSIYVLEKVFSKTKKEIGSKYDFVLNNVTSDTNTTIQIPTGDRYIPTLKTALVSGNLICVGLYSDKSDSRYSGVCYSKADENSITNQEFNEFPAELMFDKYGGEKQKELKNLNLRKISLSPDNGLFLQVEEAYVTTVQHGPNGGSTTFFNYDDIMLVKLSREGELLWARNINKRQASARTDTPFLSYGSAEENGNTYFFINAAEKVKKRDDGRIVFGQVRPNKSNLYMVKIGSDSSMDYTEILDDESAEVPFMVARGLSIKNSAYFLGQKGTSKQLLKVTVE